MRTDNTEQLNGGKNMKKVFRRTRLAAVITFTLAFVAILALEGSTNASCAEASDQQALVDGAKSTFEGFVQDKEFAWIPENLPDLKGILIVPKLVKAGFVLGGSGGRAVLLTRDSKTGKWSEPGFYSIGSVSFGLQIGGEAAEVIMAVRSQGAVDRLLSSSVKLGADAGIAAGPVGGGAKTNVMADILSFSKAKGAFVGLSLEGSVVKVSDKWNEGYYDKPGVRPTDIFIKQSVSNPGSKTLREVVKKAEKTI